MTEAQYVLLFIGPFAKTFMVWATGVLEEFFPDHRVLVAATVDEALAKDWHIMATITFLDPSIRGLDRFVSEFARWFGRGTRQVVFCGERVVEQRQPDPLVAAMNASSRYDAHWMPYGSFNDPRTEFKFVLLLMGNPMKPERLPEAVSVSAK